METPPLYTLVEFGDYQCPPCARAHSKAKQLQARYPQKLSFQFRHFPLREIHPLAEKAAIIAEVARSHGEFWKMHDYLYKMEADLDETLLPPLRSADRPALQTAQQSLAEDEDAAKRLGIDQTPTFFLCCPDGTVLQLQHIEQAEKYLR